MFELFCQQTDREKSENLTTADLGRGNKQVSYQIQIVSQHLCDKN